MVEPIQETKSGEHFQFENFKESPPLADPNSSSHESRPASLKRKAESFDDQPLESFPLSSDFDATLPTLVGETERTVDALEVFPIGNSIERCSTMVASPRTRELTRVPSEEHDSSNDQPISGTDSGQSCHRIVMQPPIAPESLYLCPRSQESDADKVSGPSGDFISAVSNSETTAVVLEPSKGNNVKLEGDNRIPPASSIPVIEELNQKDSYIKSPEFFANISSTDVEAPSHSQNVRVHFIDPSIFGNPKVHVLLDYLKHITSDYDDDELMPSDLGYPDSWYTDEMTSQ